MIYLNKILPVLVSPIFIVLTCMAISLIVKHRFWRVLPMILLATFSTPIMGNYLMGYLERDYPPLSPYDIEGTDTVVVLGGIMRTLNVDGQIRYEFSERADRFEAGITLYKQGIAQTLIFPRGHTPWSAGLPEGDVLKQWAIDRGVPADAIHLTDIVENTADEARVIRDMIPTDQKIVLITSAFHMPRAVKVFQSHGVNVIPYPVDFMANGDKITTMDFLPDAEALWQTSLFAREMLGRFYYYLKY